MNPDPVRTDRNLTHPASGSTRPAEQGWLRKSLVLGTVRPPLAETIRAALTVPIVLACSLYFFDSKIALFAALGALLVVLGERPGTTGQRLFKAGAGLLAGLLAMAAGPYTAGVGTTPLIVVLAFAILSGVLSAYGPALSFAGMQLLVQMSIAGGLTIDLPLCQKLIAYALGGGVALCGAWVLSTLEKTDRLYAAHLADVLDALVRREQFLATHPSAEDDLLARRSIDGKLTLASNLILTARAAGQRRARFLHELRAIRDGVSLTTTRCFAHASAQNLDMLQRAAQALRSGRYSELPSWLTNHPGKESEPIGKLLTRPWSNQQNAIFVFRLTLCIVSAEALRQITSLGHGYWILLTVALILKPDITSVFSRSLQRGIGTTIGVVLASFVTVLTPGYVAIALLGLLCAPIPWSVRRNYALFSALITPVVLILLDIAGSVGPVLLLQRVIGTILGCALVLLLAYALWPDTWRPTARPEIARICDELAALAASIPLDEGSPAAVAFADRRLAIAQAIAELRLRGTTALSEPRGPRLRAQHWQEVAVCLEDTLQAITTSPAGVTNQAAIRALNSISAALREKDRMAIHGLRIAADASLPGQSVVRLFNVVAHLHVFGEPNNASGFTNPPARD